MVPPLGRTPELAERLLFQEAASLAARAYAPYSGFSVGAVVVGSSGRSHHGVNVENASYPAGLCAERAALAAMVTFGERALRYVAVAAAAGADCLPCGLCLQALAEFGDPEVVARIEGEVRVLRLHDLLTVPFAGAGTDGGGSGHAAPRAAQGVAAGGGEAAGLAGGGAGAAPGPETACSPGEALRPDAARPPEEALRLDTARSPEAAGVPEASP